MVVIGSLPLSSSRLRGLGPIGPPAPRPPAAACKYFRGPAARARRFLYHGRGFVGPWALSKPRDLCFAYPLLIAALSARIGAKVFGGAAGRPRIGLCRGADHLEPAGDHRFCPCAILRGWLQAHDVRALRLLTRYVARKTPPATVFSGDGRQRRCRMTLVGHLEGGAYERAGLGTGWQRYCVHRRMRPATWLLIRCHTRSRGQRRAALAYRQWVFASRHRPALCFRKRCKRTWPSVA